MIQKKKKKKCQHFLVLILPGRAPLLVQKRPGPVNCIGPRLLTRVEDVTTFDSVNEVPPEKAIFIQFAGNEWYYTNTLILPVTRICVVIFFACE